MKLIFSLDLIRHGHRAPLKEMPKVSNIWTKADLGKLMDVGAKKAEQLGKKLRQYYVDKTNLLPSTFQPNAMLVRSTDIPRTKDTAAALLKGFYPSFVHKIKITTPPEEEDSLLMNQRNPAHKQKLQKLFKISEEIFSKSQEPLYKNARKELAIVNGIFGTKFNSANDLVYLGDLLFISKIHDKPLLKKLGKENIEQIIKLSEKIQQRFFNQHSVARIYAEMFVLHLADLIEEQVSRKTLLKYILYSGHDVNIWAIAFLLGKPIRTKTPYLANLRFEIFESSVFGQRSVRASLNGRAMKIVPGEITCPAAKFIESLRAKVSK